MSRSEYNDDCWGWDSIRWRGAVAAAIRGKRGQAFILEMWKAMTAMPEPKLISGRLELEGEVCAIGAVGKARGVDMSSLDPEDADAVANVFDIPPSLAREIVYENDEAVFRETPEQRFSRMKKWAEQNLLPVDVGPTGSD